MIEPSVGRIVWYMPRENRDSLIEGEEFLAAIITEVISTQRVNLCVFAASGYVCPRRNVLLIQEAERPERGPWCEWMPYQKGQAAKAEALETAAKVGHAGE